MKAISFSPAAADIDEIWDDTADRWGADQADSYTDVIRDACHALGRGTKQGRPSVLPDFQKYLCGSHVIYFLDHADHLDDIRILHQRQDAERRLQLITRTRSLRHWGLSAPLSMARRAGWR